MNAVLWVLLAAALQAPQTAPPRDTRPDIASPIPSGSAVIRGRVLAADTGRPLPRATVIATGTADEGGRHRASISTDGEGQYELAGVPAGRYEIFASRAGYLEGQYGQRLPRERGGILDVTETAVIDLDFRLFRASVVSGRITDEMGQPIASVSVSALEPGSSQVANPARISAPTDADGAYRIAGLKPGSYVVSAQSNDVWPSADDDGRIGYARTFFPGSTSAVGASRVSLGIGEEAAEINFSLVAGRLATISGTAADSRGMPLQGLMLLNEDGTPPSGVTLSPPDGTFRIANVRPGRYMLRAAARGELVSMPIEVNGADVEGVSIRSAPGWSLTGRVVIDSGARAALDPSRVTIMTTVETTGLASGNAPVEMGIMVGGQVVSVFVPPSQIRLGAPASARANRDGEFTVTPVFGPSRMLVVLPAGWVVMSAVAAGRDVIGRVLDLPPGAELSNVEILVTDRTAAASGRLVDEARTPVTWGTVIVFSEDPARWWPWTGAVRETRPDQKGMFRVDGLPAGRYAIAAVESIEAGMWFDQGYLQSLLPRASRFTLAEDEHRSDIALRVAR